MKTKIIQSYRTSNVPAWIDKCMLSVKSWAEYYEYEYEFMGDEFFSFCPEWYTGRDNWTVADRWIISDICRLLWIKQETKYYDRVVWVDADFLIFNKELATLGNKTHGFSFELVDNIPGKNNALMFFNRGDAILDLYYERSKELVLSSTDLLRVAIGPALLKSIDGNVLKNFGLLYRPITTQLLHDAGKDLDIYVSLLPEPIAGANMCNFIRELSGHKNEKLFLDLEMLDTVTLLLDTQGSRLNIRWAK